MFVYSEIQTLAVMQRHSTMRKILKLHVLLTAIALTSCGQSPRQKSIKPNTMKNYFDSREELLIKLYKKIDNKLAYWETWNTDEKTAIIHSGFLGEKGDAKYVNTKNHSDLKSSLNSQIIEKIKDGYQEIPLDTMFTLAITFKLKSWGTPQDLTKREEYRNIITDNLGWTGNGRCDDGDIGSGEMTLYADVVDPYVAIQTIPKELSEKKVSEEYYFTISKGDKVIAEKILPDNSVKH
jgi:hypothetical protein